ncbi:PfkB family carbohydrate kinase [Mycobacterium sp. 236(2023)]|uniref:carbohydrate kinase family protein n=1 Tax=Mycobacterium sp. 236(2023) TaxID=3038163 RepID=UPI002415266E|nr:PfkB family carbohydrate kinase [Mycobacterium sp. 236(2023)]MDG4667183.1 PfkB family carbohydrate kinase [Mycobacterium sp. 236(2023)]
MTTLGAVAVLGPHIVDILGRPVSAIPAGQGSVRLDEIRITVAGTGGGAAVDLAKLGCSVSSFAAIGDDMLGQLLHTQLAARGVNTAGLVTRRDAVTSSTILPIRPNGERPALHVPGATPTLMADDVDVDALLAADAILFGGPETTPHLLDSDGIALLEAVHAAGKPIFVDLLHPATPATLELLAPLLPLTAWFMPNDQQLRGLTGFDDLVDAAKALLARGVGAVAVTVGDQGALLVRPDVEPARVPALPTTVVDTTGCGDSFNAGMIAGLLSGCTPEDAALIGCASGALVASGLGSDAGIGDLADVLAAIAVSHPVAASRIGRTIDGHVSRGEHRDHRTRRQH